MGRNGYAISTDNVVIVNRRAPFIILESRSKPTSKLTAAHFSFLFLQKIKDNSHTFKTEGMNRSCTSQYFFCLKAILLAVPLD